MADNMKQLPAPEEQRADDWLLPILVFFGAFVVILLLVLSAHPASAPDNLTVADKQATPDVHVEITSPLNGHTVPTTFTVDFEAVGLKVEPAGEVHPDAGHFHLLIDTPFIPAGEVIPKDDTHLHFGDGALSAELTLTPGVHTLRLQFADGAHTALEGDQYRDEITVIVKE